MRLPCSLLRPIAALTVFFALTSAASALDHPIAGRAKILLVQSSGKEKLTFVARDSAFLFPAIGGADDPSQVGATVDIVPQPKHYPGVLSLTGGWTSKVGVRGSYTFKNLAAPDGVSTVRMQIVEGKQIKLTAKTIGGAGATVSHTDGFVVRVTIGTVRNCVRFGPVPAQVYGDGFKFLAKASSAEPLADCSDAAIGMPSPCDFSYPTCGGACPTGESCTTFGIDPGFGHCGCLPVGATACGTPGVPTCGGACPSGETCRSAYGLPVFGSRLGCDCGPPDPCGSGGIDCPNGFACGYLPPRTTCLPIMCGLYPACGVGPCRDGGTCTTQPLGGDSGVCVCQAP